MPTNNYFEHHTSFMEQNLIEDLTIEAIKMFGIDVVYIPRESMSRDGIFGEDIVAKFEDKYLIEMYLESVNGFEGQGDLLSKFGLQVKDTCSFIVSKRRFEETCWDITTPKEGDLIYFPLSKGLFEINFVEHENPFYQLGKLHTYQLQCELFTYSHEEFNTGYKQIDKIEKVYDDQIDLADNQEISVESDQTLDFNESNPFGEL
jgi:hypothetical protein